MEREVILSDLLAAPTLRLFIHFSYFFSASSGFGIPVPRVLKTERLQVYPKEKMKSRVYVEETAPQLRRRERRLGKEKGRVGREMHHHRVEATTMQKEEKEGEEKEGEERKSKQKAVAIERKTYVLLRTKRRDKGGKRAKSPESEFEILPLLFSKYDFQDRTVDQWGNTTARSAATHAPREQQPKNRKATWASTPKSVTDKKAKTRTNGLAL